MAKRQTLDLGDIGSLGIKVVVGGSLLWVAYFAYQASRKGL